MTVPEVLRDIMKKRNVRNIDLENALGMKSNTLIGRLKHDNPSVNTLGELMKAMGYKIVLVPEEEEVREEWYEIGNPGDSVKRIEREPELPKEKLGDLSVSDLRELIRSIMKEEK